MAKAEQLLVKESISELKRLLGNHNVTISSRIRMLITIKNHPQGGLSKRALAKILGVSSSSTQIWRNLYKKGGIELLLKDGRTGFKATDEISESIVKSTCAYKYIFFDTF